MDSQVLFVCLFVLENNAAPEFLNFTKERDDPVEEFC